MWRSFSYTQLTQLKLRHPLRATLKFISVGDKMIMTVSNNEDRIDGRRLMLDLRTI